MLRALITVVGLAAIAVGAALGFGFLELSGGPSLSPGPRLVDGVDGAVDAKTTDRRSAPIGAGPAKPVKLFTVEASSPRVSVLLPATIEAAQEANLAFDIGGRIIELTVDKSAEVEKGAVIARLDADDLENSVTEAEAELSRAESEYQRGLRLRERDAISVSAVESRRTQRDVAAATLATAKKRLEDATLRAPFAGYIADVPVEAFQTVAANQTVAVLQTTGVAAVVNMPADFVVFSPQFEPLDPVVILDALPGKELPAEFFEAAGVADEETQTYEASFIFKPSEDLLVLPGMTATIRTELQFQEETERFAQSGVSAPVSSIVSIGERLFVWVYDGATSTLSSRDVAIGEGVGGFVVVREGLQPGETIVAAGGAALDEGMVVRPWSTD